MFKEVHLSSPSSVKFLIYTMHMCVYMYMFKYVSSNLCNSLCVAQSSPMPGIVSINLYQIPLKGAKRMSRIKYNIN